MATNSRADGLPVEPIPSLDGLIKLYRSTFVKVMQARLRFMLEEAYSVYIAALGEGFDPVLHAHLADVLQDLVARSSELSELFGGELLDYFRRMLAPVPAGGKGGTSGERFPVYGGEDIELRELISKTNRAVERRYGDKILAVTLTYIKLAGEPAAEMTLAWSSASLFSAFSAVLRELEVPVHSKVRLVLFKLFAREVVTYIGEACSAFRDLVPVELSRLQSAAGRAEPGAIQAVPAGADLSSRGVAPLSRQGSGVVFEASPVAVQSGPTPLIPIGEAATVRPLESREKNRFRRSVMLLSRFASVLALIWFAWWLGGELARLRAVSAPGSTTAAFEPDVLPAGVAAAKPSATETDKPKTPASGIDPLLPILGEPGKRDILRAVKLKNFSWTVEPSASGMLFDLTIANTSGYWVAGIEVVCSQYSSELNFLEAAKTVLDPSIGPGDDGTFRDIRLGFAHRDTERVNCVIADLAIESRP
jgi:hypothetical protein